MVCRSTKACASSRVMESPYAILWIVCWVHTLTSFWMWIEPSVVATAFTKFAVLLYTSSGLQAPSDKPKTRSMIGRTKAWISSD